ncbi:ROK family transcriptional regulator [Streptomyces formicae]|uniref:ROK family transcriptional regulator n=1 Tax=Streptomyces formicae TaxID=1616117 RepID=A0ABY3WP36_9ACTN|nr:ROK family transcriptional regulator [Streptomyces formicae]UNM13425.1 ROK family transcriptional regulator [Streptomyces formicae]
MAAPHGAVREDRYVVRDRNRASVFGAIVTKGPIARSEIARLTGLSQATVTKAVAPMIEAGYVAEQEGSSGGPGRPRVPLHICPDRRFAVGVKVTEREAVGVVVDLAGEVRAECRTALDSRAVPDVVARVAELVGQLMGEDASFAQRTFDLGVALGGQVDVDHQVLRTSAMLGWYEVPLARLLEESTGLRTVIENDVNALAVTEQWFGVGVDVPWFAVVTLGAGVGGALVLDGKLIRGARGAAGEVGHVMVEPGGRLCRCGNRGCVETIASDPAILAAIAETGGPDVLDIAAAVELARAGDAAAFLAFMRAGVALGSGIAALANLVNPERIVISGEGLVASDLFMNSLRETFAARTLLPADDFELVTRPLPDEAWARGAAAVALQDIFVGALQPAGAAPTA